MILQIPVGLGHSIQPPHFPFHAFLSVGGGNLMRHTEKALIQNLEEDVYQDKYCRRSLQSYVPGHSLRNLLGLMTKKRTHSGNEHRTCFSFPSVTSSTKSAFVGSFLYVKALLYRQWKERKRARKNFLCFPHKVSKSPSAVPKGTGEGFGGRKNTSKTSRVKDSGTTKRRMSNYRYRIGLTVAVNPLQRE